MRAVGCEERKGGDVSNRNPTDEGNRSKTKGKAAYKLCIEAEKDQVTVDSIVPQCTVYKEGPKPRKMVVVKVEIVSISL
jgi:hypothetical protein